MSNEKNSLNLESNDSAISKAQTSDLEQANEEVVPLPMTPPSPATAEERRRLANMMNPLESRTAKSMENINDMQKGQEESPGEKEQNNMPVKGDH